MAYIYTVDKASCTASSLGEKLLKAVFNAFLAVHMV
jgi:hypothetical protein